MRFRGTENGLGGGGLRLPGRQYDIPATTPVIPGLKRGFHRAHTVACAREPLRPLSWLSAARGRGLVPRERVLSRNAALAHLGFRLSFYASKRIAEVLKAQSRTFGQLNHQFQIAADRAHVIAQGR